MAVITLHCSMMHGFIKWADRSINVIPWAWPLYHNILAARSIYSTVVANIAQLSPTRLFV